MWYAHTGIAALASLAAWTPIAAAQSGTLYLTDGGAQNGYIVNDMSATSFSLMSEGESPIVVTNEIRTSGSHTNVPGSIYELDGTHKGGPLFVSDPLESVYDAGTDGRSIYLIEFESGDVYRAGMDYADAEFMFNASDASTEMLGITYNTMTDSIWVSEWNGVELIEFDTQGNELSRFSTGHLGNAALAYDSTDNTLWLHDRSVNGFEGGIYEQWTTDGQLLFRGTISGLEGANVLGAEFGAVPAPGTLALLAGAGAIGARRRR